MSSAQGTRARSEESWRRPQFWTHPAHYHHDHLQFAEDESPEEPLLSHHFPHTAVRRNGFGRSLIPFSPGQTLGLHPQSYTPLTMQYRYGQIDVPISEGDEHTSGSSRGCCWRWLLCCCCCGPSEQAVHNSWTEETHLRQVHLGHYSTHEERRRSGGGCRWSIFHLFLSAATLCGLYYYTSTTDHQCWTMNPGESRRAATAGFLTDSLQVVSQSRSTGRRPRTNNETITRGIAVYATDEPECPPLTGPAVTLDAPPQELELLHNAFEYQYFYLNKGSTMQVTVHQAKGATNILVLRGNKVLARIQDKHKNPIYKQHSREVFSDLELLFSMDQVVLERFSREHERAPIRFSFTSPASEVYVLLFDNAASSESSTFNVSYHMVLTTYDLEVLVPWCSQDAPAASSEEDTSFACPPLQVSTGQCIIVEATDGHEDSRNATRNYFPLLDDDGVEVVLYTTRSWRYIGVLSVIPSGLLALICCYRRRRQWRRQRRRTFRHWEEGHFRHQHAPHRQQRPARHQEPNYHYLWPQHPESTDRDMAEQGEMGASAGEDAPSGSHHRTLSAGFVGQHTSNCPCTTEAVENERQDATETTMISAAHVVVVKQEE